MSSQDDKSPPRLGDVSAERRIRNVLDEAVHQGADVAETERRADGETPTSPQTQSEFHGGGNGDAGTYTHGPSDGDEDPYRQRRGHQTGGQQPGRDTTGMKNQSTDSQIASVGQQRTKDQGSHATAKPNGKYAVEDDDLPLAREAKRAVRLLNPAGRDMMPRPATRRVIAVANQKGGVGKTTSAVNLAVSLALHGNRVMVIDLDPQGNASTGLGVDHSTGTPSVYEAIIDQAPMDDVTHKVDGIPNLVCVPATIDLAGSEVELVNVVAREARLKNAIASYSHELDYILIDCPPSLGLLTVNALVAAEEILIPIQCEYYALEGLGQLLRNIELVKGHLNSQLRVSTILLTMYDKRTKLADQVEQEVRGHFQDTVLKAVVPRSVRVSEAPGYGQSVMTYDPGSRGASSYFEAAEEIAQRGAQMRS